MNVSRNTHRFWEGRGQPWPSFYSRPLVADRIRDGGLLGGIREPDSLFECIIGEHGVRVGVISALLTRELGFSEDQAQTLRHAAQLHDLGKAVLPERILLKAGGLTEKEFEKVKLHTTVGARVVSEDSSPLGRPLRRMAAETAFSHHERWDGSGYPCGLIGEGIPLCARIVAVADVFDALTHERPYKEAWSREDATRELKLQQSHLFDPHIVEAFHKLQDRNDFLPTRTGRGSRAVLAAENSSQN